jgi:hypothetical protein
MPVFSYFIVAGTTLLGLLFWWASADDRADGSAVQTSQTIGLPEPFKPPADLPQYRVTGVNFAIPYERRSRVGVRQAKKAKLAEAAARPKTARKKWDAPPPNLFAEFSRDPPSVR